MAILLDIFDVCPYNHFCMFGFDFFIRFDVTSELKSKQKQGNEIKTTIGEDREFAATASFRPRDVRLGGLTYDLYYTTSGRKAINQIRRKPYNSATRLRI